MGVLNWAAEKGPKNFVKVSKAVGNVVAAPVVVTAKAVTGAAEGVAQAAGLKEISLVESAKLRANARAQAADVNAPTPADRWFTPRKGWGDATDKKGGQPNLMLPTETGCAALFPEEESVIGELKVEILEARGLPNTDAIIANMALGGNKTDSYASVVFESNAARTSVVRDSLEPQWGATDPNSFRAFRFPVQQPYSVLYVCIADYDGSRKQEMATAEAIAAAKAAGKDREASKRSSLDADDPIGRVGIQLGRLIGSAEYDCWFELGYGAIQRPTGKLGHVRLRLSVTFKSERQRMLGYLKPPPTHALPLMKRTYRANAIFAKRGALADENYDWDVLMIYVDELKAVAKLAIYFLAGAESILLWRGPVIHLSLAGCVAFQLLVSFPNLFPASWCLMFVVLLLSTYAVPSQDERLDEAIAQRPSFPQLCMALATDKKPVAEAVGMIDEDQLRPDVQHMLDSPRGARFSRERMGRGSIQPASPMTAKQEIITQLYLEAKEYWEEKILGKEDSGDEQKEETLEFQKALIEKEVEQFIDEGDDSPEEKLEKKRAKEAATTTMWSKVGATLNPMAAALGPVQNLLAKLMPTMRRVRYMLFWNDRILTTWLVIGLCAAALVLAIIPWGFIIYWGARVFGLVVFGPHMYFVGRRVDAQRQKDRDDAMAYTNGSKKERQRMLDAYRAELMEDAHKQVDKAKEALAARSAREQEKHAYLAHQKYVFLNANTRGNANIKYTAAADPTRSTLRPLNLEEPAAPVEVRRGQSNAAELL